MTPEELATMEIEAAAWKSKDGRRAMKMLDLNVGLNAFPVVLVVDGDVFMTHGIRTGRPGPIPCALAVAFLKQQAWRKFPHGLPMDYDHPGRTDTDRLIAAILASKKGTKP